MKTLEHYRTLLSLLLLEPDTFKHPTYHGYAIYYVSHECSHVIAGHSAKHGPDFMAVLKRICPVQYIHYETGYKPQNAAAAGISKEPVIVLESLGDIDDSTEDTIDYSVDLFDL